jgi:hypothetical protein
MGGGRLVKLAVSASFGKRPDPLTATIEFAEECHASGSGAFAREHGGRT